MEPSVSSLAELRRRAAADLFDNILPFWTKYAFEPETGRLVGIVTNDLRQFDDVPRHSVLCARLLWTFAAAARREPRPEWLEMGRKALALLTGEFWDGEHGGVYWSLDRTGQVLSNRKQVYAEAFAVYGLTEWYAATGDRAALARAQNLFELIERHAAEATAGGYFEARSVDWGELKDMRLSDKDLNAPKSMNTHLHILEAYTALFRQWPEARMRASLRALLEVMLDRIVATQPRTHCQLFFDLEWRSLLAKMSYGHDIEASWLLWDTAEALAEPALLERTKRVAIDLAEAVRAHGVDSDGAVFYDGDINEALNTAKLWWPQAEAVVGFLNAYQLEGSEIFLDAALRTWQFIENHVIDHRHGEWFALLNREGDPLPDYPAHPESHKIGPWKCPYHNARACLEVMRRVPAS